MKYVTVLRLAFHIQIINGSRFISCHRVRKCQQLRRKKLGPPIILYPCFLATQLQCKSLLYPFIRSQPVSREMKHATSKNAFSLPGLPGSNSTFRVSNIKTTLVLCYSLNVSGDEIYICLHIKSCQAILFLVEMRETFSPHFPNKHRMVISRKKSLWQSFIVPG